MRGHTDQMMPPENLMQDDSVRQATESHPENETRPNQRILEYPVHGVGLVTVASARASWRIIAVGLNLDSSRA